MTLPEVILPPALKGRLAAGHPWIYRTQIAFQPELPTGSWVRIGSGSFRAFGLWDSRGQIAIRLFSARAVPDAAWVARQVRRAWELRAPLRDQGITAYRWIFGEADGLPGITVDLYGGFAAVQFSSAGVAALLPWLLEALRGVASLQGIVLRRRKLEGDAVEVERAEGGSAELLWGKLPPRDLVVEEYGLRLYANLFAGQKTGLFLDQRENRHFLESWCQDRTVLNCFSYTGAFSLYAARGGASAVISCDSAAASAEAAAANFELNGFNPRNYAFLTEECFAFLARLAEERQAFDLVILDPPSFAHSKKHVYSALRGYTKLYQLALRCVRHGGLLAAASCTSYVTPDLFRQALSDAAASLGRRLLIVHEAGQPLDHPVSVSFPEGRYLKFLLCAVQEA